MAGVSGKDRPAAFKVTNCDLKLSHSSFELKREILRESLLVPPESLIENAGFNPVNARQVAEDQRPKASHYSALREQAIEFASSGKSEER